MKSRGVNRVALLAVVLVQVLWGLLAAGFERSSGGMGILLVVPTWMSAMLIFNNGIERRALRGGTWALWQAVKLLLAVLFWPVLFGVMEECGFPREFAHGVIWAAFATWALFCFCLFSGRSVLGERVGKEERERFGAKRSISLSHCVGTVGTVLMMGWAIAIGGGAGFINVPSVMITLGVTGLLLYGNYGRDYLAFTSDSILTLFSKPPQPVPLYVEIAKAGSRYVVGAGLAGTLIGLIQMLRNLSDPSSIGVGMAVSLITVLYAVIASEFYCAFMIVEYSPKSDRATNGPESGRSLSLLAIGVGVVLISFVACVIALSFV